MKTLYIVRHAKSSWKFREKRDYERPLNQRGLENGAKMAEYIKKMGESVDLIVSSPAKRAHDTALIFAEKLEYNPEKIQLNSSIYESSLKELFAITLSIPQDVNSAMIFGHEPTLSSYTEFLTNKYFEKVPTSGIVKIQFATDNWNKITAKSGELVYFIYPKKVLL
ncbi:MAG: hypothetical protein EA412_03135 [Chitinophagaceae bacterium]|nr:MAG: hypothetical protein EA412_03135 [Chitinophagaceae bacterium]